MNFRTGGINPKFAVRLEKRIFAESVRNLREKARFAMTDTQWYSKAQKGMGKCRKRQKKSREDG